MPKSDIREDAIGNDDMLVKPRKESSPAQYIFIE
tara:strand:- start:612 stop:713 length:102 start_codon:yes stop_codon:yes gene_type:complete